eukprot:SM000120S25691  [mRNA]  locus=s120:137675:139748:- [translate_table: standard]
MAAFGARVLLAAVLVCLSWSAAEPARSRARTPARSSCTAHCLNGGMCRESGVHDKCDCPAPNATHPTFFLGEHCETPATMCADTNQFFCANGGTCNEIVQGEMYTCEKCDAGFGGEHCTLMGEPCGGGADGHPSTFCFNNGTCDQELEQCVCPEDWLGSDDCSTRTPAPDPNAPPGLDFTGRKGGDGSWIGATFGTIGGLVLLGAIAYLAYRHYQDQNRRFGKGGRVKFQDLRKELEMEEEL